MSDQFNSVLLDEDESYLKKDNVGDGLQGVIGKGKTIKQGGLGSLLSDTDLVESAEKAENNNNNNNGPGESILSDDTSHKNESHGLAKREDEEANMFINSTVSNPQKESDGQSSYVSYLVETRTNNPVFKSHLIKVRRRFSDFYFLYRCLLNDYPVSAIPPLPDKQRLEYIKGDRFGYDFTHKRASSLNSFLKRMSIHPILKRAKIYQIFLELNDWNSYKDNLNVNFSANHTNNDFENTGGVSSNVSDLISELFMNAFKQPQMKSNKEFIEINERCNILNDNVTKIDKVFQKYIKRLNDLSNNYAAFANLVIRLNSLSIPKNDKLMTENEDVIVDQPKAMSINEESSRLEMNRKVLSSTENNGQHNNSYYIFSKGLENFSISLNQLKRYLDNDYLISQKDLEHYIGTIQKLIKLKEQKQIDFEVLSEYLSRVIHEKNDLLKQIDLSNGVSEDILNPNVIKPYDTKTVSNNPGIKLPEPKPSTLTTLANSTSNFLTSKFDDLRGINTVYQKKQRLINLQSKIETLEVEVVKAKDIYESYETQILHEIQYFDVIKSNELKLNLSKLSLNYISFYENLIDDWSKVEATLQKDIDDYDEVDEVQT